MDDTDPESWFHPKVPFTIGNDVVGLVDGAAYMKHLYDRVLGMREGDALFFTAWRGTPEQKLRPDLSTRDTRFLSVLMDLVRRRVTVRLLAWYVPLTAISTRSLPSSHNRENANLVKDMRAAIEKSGLGGSAYLDQRLPSIIASHHQKSAVLTSDGDPWAYVGGIDVALDRWDSPDHDGSKDRQRELLEGWHDVHCVIQGPAVATIAENFRDRWNERKPPVRGQPSDMPAPIKAPLVVPETSRGTVAVQRLRTFACGGVYDFRPTGEQTSREGINRAIDQAKFFVYLEDQYFWPSTTVEALTRAVRRGVHVFMVLAKEYELSGPLATAHYEMRQEALGQLRSAGIDRVVCCHLEQLKGGAQIYVHSKFWIVDDRFVSIGSTNVGRRSHTTDTELNVSMVDATLQQGEIAGLPRQVGKFARDLRLRVWAEHLNLPESELADPIAAKAKWPRQGRGSKKVHHAAYHSGAPPQAVLGLSDWYEFLKALREIARQPAPWPNATSEELALVESATLLLDTVGLSALSTGLSDLALGPLWWAPRIGLRDRLLSFVKNRLMNVETSCS